jgi:hypothetical protein
MSATTEPTYLRPAIVTAVGSVIVGLALTCMFASFGWQSGSVGSLRDLVGTGVRTWLVSHGSGLTANGIVLDAIPLGASLIAVAIVACASLKALTRWEGGTDSGHDAVPYIAVTAATYGILAGMLSAATNSGGHSTHFVRSAIGGVVIAALGAAVGLALHTGGSDVLLSGPGEVRSVIGAASRGVAAILATALALVTLLFALHVGRASEMWASLDPGVLGSIGLAGICLAVLPNLVLWTVAALLGPGFALGTDTSVDLTGAHLGAVPGLPILAGLPAPGGFPGWVFLLGLIPLLAGVYAGWRVVAADRPWLHQMGMGVAAGALAGVVCGVLVALSGGAIGPGRMSVVGPDRIAPILVAIAVLALGGAIGAGLRVARQDAGSR